MLKSVVVDHALLGRRSAAAAYWDDTIIYEAHVKGLTQLREMSRRGARPLPRPVASRDDRSSAQARRDRDRTAAGPCLRRRPLSGRHGLRNYWGYNSIGFFAPEARYAQRQLIDEFRPRSPSFTRPASRSFSTSSTTTPPKAMSSARRCAPRHRQRLLLLAQPGQAALLREFHRHRQRAQPGASARAADGHGLAALLGRELPRRRLPLRSRHDARRAGRTFDPQCAVFRHVAQDPVLAGSS